MILRLRCFGVLIRDIQVDLARVVYLKYLNKIDFDGKREVITRMDCKMGITSNARFPGMMCRVYSLSPITRITASPVAPGVKNTPANAGDTQTT